MIFIFNIILAYLSIDFSRLDDSMEQFKIVMFASVFIISLSLFILAFVQKRQREKIHQKIFFMQNSFLDFEKKLNVQDTLDLLKEKFDNTIQVLAKISDEKESYLHLLEENLYQFKNIFHAMLCLDENYDKKINTLILNVLNFQSEQIALALHQMPKYAKSMNHDKIFQFQASVAIVNDDELEAFLLANALSYFGIESVYFKDLSFNVNDFHLVFIKDKILNENVKKNYNFVIMSRCNNASYEDFLSLPFERKDLENILQNKLDKTCILEFKTLYENNVLLFKQKDFDTTLFFNIIQKQCDKNICINSFVQLKQELSKKAYRLILLDYDLVQLDYQRMKNFLHAYKKQYPQSHIVFFAKEDVKDFDCASEVLSDVSKKDFVHLLKKYLPKV